MSEEILKALTTLFALIVKQDGGANENEIAYVKRFLIKQLNPETASEYFALFLKEVKIKDSIETGSLDDRQKELVSVKDSVKILGIAKKISKTLDQKQKVVVLVRLFELINSDRQFTEQRMSIIDTVSKVFRISGEEYSSIERFACSNLEGGISDPDIMVVSDETGIVNSSRFILVKDLDGSLVILRVKSVDLYFFRYSGQQVCQLNGLNINRESIYMLAYGSALKLPVGKPVYYSDVVDHFQDELEYARISYHVHDLEYRFKSGKIGVRNISLSEKQGRLVGILGASGAGKTTLFNVLSGLEKPSKGKVLINGIDLHREKKKLEGVIGYIPQDDLLIEELTVFKNLYYNAKLCFSGKSAEEISEMVNHLLASLGLSETANLKVGSPMNKTISGGQRKRLNIALELIREPSILFVDEPTSGLSSQDSENVMNLLRELVLKGKLVFVVIHQPSSDIYKMFDSVIIMDKGGYMIYYGNPVEGVVYFKKKDVQVESEAGECSMCGNINPELIFNIVEAKIVDDYGNYTDQRKVSPVIWEKYFNNQHKPEYTQIENEEPARTSKPPGWIKQIITFFQRDFFAKISNRQYILLNIIEAPLLGFILAYLIRFISDPNSSKYVFRENENIPHYIFMTIIVALFLGMIVSAEEIYRDRKILKREKFLNLSISGYFLSKIAILVMLSAIQALLFIIVGNSILGIRGMLLEYWFAFFTTSVFANLLGLNISASFNSAVTIYIIIPLMMIPQMILGGAMFSFDKLNRSVNSVEKVPLVAEFITSKWAYEALMVYQFKDNLFEKTFYELEKKESIADFKQVYLIPELFEKLDACEDILQNANTSGSIDSLKQGMELLRFEIAREQKLNSNLPGFNFPEASEKGLFNEDNFNAIRDYLGIIETFYTEMFNDAYSKREKAVAYMNETQPGLYYKRKDAFFNEGVSDIVRKVYEKNKILEFRSHFVQNVDPIYLDADNSSYIGFRAHFLAPNKFFMGKYYDTFWFNMAVIWFMTVLMYIALYFGLLKKAVEINISSLFGKKKQEE